MNSIRAFHSVAQGESHKLKDIPCQDAATSFEDQEKKIFFGVVSDGHGSKEYFRSDRGSKILVNVAKEKIIDFVNNINKDSFDIEFTAIPVISEQQHTEDNEEPKRKVKPHIEALRFLCSSIISKWNDAIKEDWDNDRPNNEDLQMLQVPDAYIKSYLANNDIEMAYGCTLLAFLRTDSYWFAFQLGDGKCIAFSDEGEGWEPIPWDNQCSGNLTTSICESNALQNFRYCFGNNRFPVALFVGSDGMDGAYGTMDEYSVPQLTGLYSNIIKSFVVNGFDKTKLEIDELLHKLSALGVTRDDMSIAGWIDFEEAKKIHSVLIQKDIALINNRIAEIDERHKNALSTTEKIEKDKIELQDKLKKLENELIGLKLADDGNHDQTCIEDKDDFSEADIENENDRQQQTGEL